MARATSIYVVRLDIGGLKALFTVKHECKTWLRKNGGDLHHLEVWTYPDGGGHVKAASTAKEFLDDGG